MDQIVIIGLVLLAGFLACCYVWSERFSTFVKRRLTFQRLDYDPLAEILENGSPNKIVIECLHARYSSNRAVLFDEHVAFYPQSDRVTVCRMRFDESFPIAHIFLTVLKNNFTWSKLLGLPEKPKPKIRIDYKLYQVLSFESDAEYLLIYIEH